MKIGIAFPGCHRRGGVERVTFECAQHLSRSGHAVSVLANEWDDLPDSTVEMIRVRPAKGPGFLQPWLFLRHCTTALAGRNFDVLITHGVVCPYGGIHWVQSVHAAWLEQATRFRKKGSWTWWKQRLNPIHTVLLHLERQHFAKRRYRHLVATTPAVKQDLERLYGVPAQDVTVLPNGFNPAEFNPRLRVQRRDAVRTELGLQPGDLALLFPVNELERKGFGTLLKALASLRDPRIKLVVVGRYPHAEAIKQAAAAGVSPAIVSFQPPTSDIARYHAACDAMVLPTQYEAFCLAVVESLGSGLPVITSGVPGARDTIRHGENGLIVEDPDDWEALGQAIHQLREPSRLSRMSAAAPTSVAHLQWTGIISSFERLISALGAPRLATA